MKVLYALLVLVPVALAMDFFDIGGHTSIFVVSALALVPLAAILGRATEEVAVYTGPKIGGLLNATLGNAAELIITIVALREGLVTVVKASITGSIIGNVLLVLGAAVFLGGLEERGPEVRSPERRRKRFGDVARRDGDDDPGHLRAREP